MSDPVLDSDKQHNVSELPSFSFDLSQLSSQGQDPVEEEKSSEETHPSPLQETSEWALAMGLPVLPETTSEPKLALEGVALKSFGEDTLDAVEPLKNPSVPVWPWWVVGGCAVVCVLAVLAKKPVLDWLASRSQGPVVAENSDPSSDAAFYVAQGVSAFYAKDYTKALHDFRIALQYDPELAPAHRSMAVVLATLGQSKAALEHYRAYLRVMPQAPDAAEVKGLIQEYERFHPL